MLRTAYRPLAHRHYIPVQGFRVRLQSSGSVAAFLPSRVNAPTTLPPPLVLPEARKPEEYRLKYAYKVGKSYLQFYKTGFKQILGNRKTAKLIRARHVDDPILRSIPGTNVDHKTGQLITAAHGHDKLTRAEFQFIKRHAKDIKKVPVFAVLLAIFGEWLPLFVIFLDPLIPGTVLLPVQVSKRRRKANKATEGSVTITPHRIRGDLEGAGIHDRAQLVRVAKQFSLLGPISQFFTDSAILSRIRRHEQYLRTDDTLLRRDLTLPIDTILEPEETDDNNTLTVNELELAIEERGLWTDEQSKEQRAKLLNAWLEKE
ncbi:Putative uncharacterized protein [Taphrina deformans PYCC 5710]|uniref:Letm1 RBD domain-containing protein n=1 Tax=Taphrina deformans (strain PYCC 5710 / ATCC 11124 / CBS 356.35 / IMI 108563 / JCM 9778 / NBRC 8474) TaxID=1097556 RepID=R4XC42_TAPDE|nr:Putative uncharacterized protein [Taphrina deformans PYCC 5710]|eukprot:CCG83391.1 Putative uncharacterized protein [Taphrina deformans PYCC 5710]